MSIGNIVAYDKLDREAQELIHQGYHARGFSYSPYSKFAVGAALRLSDTTIRIGCNIENASFSATICAERCALARAISDGHRSFHSICVVAKSIDGKLTTPCGVCRQMLCEFGDFPVYITDLDMKEVLVTTTYELLPHAFVRTNFILDNAN